MEFLGRYRADRAKVVWLAICIVAAATYAFVSRPHGLANVGAVTVANSNVCSLPAPASAVGGDAGAGKPDPAARSCEAR
jgi:hypothetical protein